MKISLHALWLVSLAALSLVLPASAQQRYTFTDLGKNNIARVVNSYGQVVGQGGFLWTPDRSGGTTGSVTYLTATIPGAYPVWINAGGQVVGTYNTTNGSGATIRHSFLWTPIAANGTTGAWIDLDSTVPTGWILNNASCINDAGLIVGAGHFTDPVTNLTVYGQYGWFRDTLNRVTMSLIPVHSTGDADTLNNIAPPQVAAEDFIWQSGITTAIGQANGFMSSSSQSRGINDFGQVAGQGLYSGVSSTWHAFLWTPDVANGTVSTPGMQDIHPTGYYQSYARGLNNFGQVVGVAQPLSSSLFGAALWDGAGCHSLAGLTTLPTAWYSLVQAYGINSRTVLNASGVRVPAAQIVGWGRITVTTTTVVHNKITTITTSEDHGFLLTPQ